MVGLTALDMLVILLVGGGIAFGFLRGFVGEVLTLMAWVAAVMALMLFFDPAAAILGPSVGAGAPILAFALVFGIVFILGKLIARRIGAATRRSVIGPVDRVLGAGFGALKGLIVATLLYLAAALVYDTIWGISAPRPDWMRQSRSWPLLHGSGEAIVGFVSERRRAAEDAAERNAA